MSDTLTRKAVLNRVEAALFPERVCPKCGRVSRFGLPGKGWWCFCPKTEARVGYGRSIKGGGWFWFKESA